MIDFDEQYRSTFKLIGGADEVGRGCLAGPVVSAAVILPEQVSFTFLNDSKQLTKSQRDIAANEIKTQAVSFAICERSVESIDKINILEASKQAMIEAILNLTPSPDCILIDGNQRIEIDLHQETIVKGDSKSAAIAAASILAKVYRDNLMEKLASEFPDYLFESNMGYASKEHRDAIIKFGPCIHHRKTFLKNVLQKRQQMDLFE